MCDTSVSGDTTSEKILDILFMFLLNELVNTILYADEQILMATSEDELQTMAYRLNIIARK